MKLFPSALHGLFGFRAAQAAVYGLRWDTTNDLYQPVHVINGAITALDYSSYPIQARMQRCVLTNGGVVQYYLHAANSLLKADGSTADLSGGAGHVMVQVPRFSYAIFNDGVYSFFLTSLRPFDVRVGGVSVSSSVHPWFYEGGLTTPAAYRYVGAFEGVLYRGAANVHGTGSQTLATGDKIRSVSGFKPLTYFNLTERRTASADGVFHQCSFYAREALILLWLTEYKSWNSQGLLPGYTEGGSWNFAKTCRTGITVGLGNASGSVLWQNASPELRCTVDQTNKYVANTFRGIENPFGHLWEWTDGCNVNFVGSPLTAARIYISNNPSQFADNTATNYTNTGIDSPLTSGYQRSLHAGTLLPNSVSGASGTTFIRDYFYASSAAGWRALLSGGALYYGATAGVAARGATNAASGRDATVGGRVSA